MLIDRFSLDRGLSIMVQGRDHYRQGDCAVAWIHPALHGSRQESTVGRLEVSILGESIQVSGELPEFRREEGWGPGMVHSQRRQQHH